MAATGLNVLRPRNPFEVFCLYALTFCAAAARLPALGERSLWLDEFSTWHVARLPLWQSLTWEAELTPPLYQLCVRAVLTLANAADDPAPEWLLRLPAALTLLVAPYPGSGAWPHPELIAHLRPQLLLQPAGVTYPPGVQAALAQAPALAPIPNDALVTIRSDGRSFTLSARPYAADVVQR
ncbi:MAG: hypothetical protein HUU27_03915 [Phycisphaerae bacterium]|nr:hypothetical protein [Phycisphaerae bacterium]